MTRRVSLVGNVLLIAVAILFVVVLFNRDYLMRRGAADKRALESGAVASLSSTEVSRMVAAGQQVVILDLRDRDSYTKEHIAQAKNIPFDELEARVLDELSPADTIVTYCDCPTEGVSKTGYQILVEEGFKSVVLTDGLKGWKSAGLPVESIPPPDAR
jgi:rhodanese-related sulfurtransferase